VISAGGGAAAADIELVEFVRCPLENLGDGAAAESGVEMGEGVALDLAVGFFSGAELGDGAHFT
jgi:hypothetical protein